MNILELLKYFNGRIDNRLAKRKRTENYLALIREQILLMRTPHVPVRKLYLTLITDKGCEFTYQYFMKIVESNWNTIVDEDNRCYLIVSSENNRLCGW